MSLELESRGIGLAEAAAAQLDARPALDDVLRDEADFANRDYAQWFNMLEINSRMFVKYERPTQLWDWRQLAAALLGELTGKSLLDFGCGMGEESVYFAKLGAHVTAIDISEVGIDTAKRRAEHNKVDIRAYEMRCDPTSFADKSFDLVYGMGILHHTGIEPGLTEVHRVLKPGGVGVFLEPMGDVRQVEAVKSFLMRKARFLGDFHDVTDHEHNLTWDEIAFATRRFRRTITYPYHLLYRLKRLFAYERWDSLKRIDHAILSMFPELKRFAGAAVIKVVK